MLRFLKKTKQKKLLFMVVAVLYCHLELLYSLALYFCFNGMQKFGPIILEQKGPNSSKNMFSFLRGNTFTRHIEIGYVTRYF